MRLIDADRLQKQFNEKSTNPNYRVNMHNIKSIINNAPTVEAIPKADYEARLKADMVAMLEELKKEIVELPFPQKRASYMQGYNYCQMNILDYVIQEKINSLKAESEG